MTTRQLAETTVASLRLHRLVREWNRGDGAKIATFRDLELAISMDRPLQAEYAAAHDRAEAAGQGSDFRDDLEGLLNPVITGSYAVALDAGLATWAYERATYDPATHATLTPFATREAWIAWVLNRADRPVALVGPYGEDLLDDASARDLLSRALVAASGSAARHGWILPIEPR
jgi:hypothetical protein